MAAFLNKFGAIETAILRQRFVSRQPILMQCRWKVRVLKRQPIRVLTADELDRQARLPRQLKHATVVETQTKYEFGELRKGVDFEVLAVGDRRFGLVLSYWEFDES